jgi:hypothetical protein
LGREAARKTELEIQDTRSKRVAKLSPNPKSLFLSMEQTICPAICAIAFNLSLSERPRAIKEFALINVMAPTYFFNS